LSEYLKNTATTSQMKTQMNQLSINQATLAASASLPLRQQQQNVVDKKTGKKKIMPKIEQVFQDSNIALNPHLNPFTQLTDHNPQSPPPPNQKL
jgi:ABC-type dipeptide/oligopeptide/nickel transport system ATPase subunit